MEARAKAIGHTDAFYYMWPENSIPAATAQALAAAGIDANRVMPDIHVEAGGGVATAMADFAAQPSFNERAINCETNAATSHMLRAVQEAADLQAWFNVSAPLQDRLFARTASFCTGSSGHMDNYDQWVFDQQLVFFLPNQTWFQPPAYVHTMIAASWADNALRFSVAGGGSTAWLAASAQLSDDNTTMTIQLVNSDTSAVPATVEVSINGFTPAPKVVVTTLAEQGLTPGTAPNPKAGNPVGMPTLISPVDTATTWPVSGPLTLSIPPLSFTVLVVHAVV